MLTVFLHLSELGLGSIADFFNTGAKAPTSTERAPCLPSERAMWFVCMVWIRVMVFFRKLLYIYT